MSTVPLPLALKPEAEVITTDPLVPPSGVIVEPDSKTRPPPVPLPLAPALIIAAPPDDP
jgi:hypothetical protein